MGRMCKVPKGFVMASFLAIILIIGSLMLLCLIVAEE